MNLRLLLIFVALNLPINTHLKLEQEKKLVLLETYHYLAEHLEILAMATLMKASKEEKL